MIKTTTEVLISNGTNCFVWKEYRKNDRLIGFAIIGRTYTSVILCKKDNNFETRYTR